MFLISKSQANPSPTHLLTTYCTRKKCLTKSSSSLKLHINKNVANDRDGFPEAIVKHTLYEGAAVGRVWAFVSPLSGTCGEIRKKFLLVKTQVKIISKQATVCVYLITFR